MKIKDNITIRDNSSKGLRGFVTMKIDGQIVFKKHNIITDVGRKWISDTIIGKVPGVTPLAESLADYELKEAWFGQGNDISTADMTYSSLMLSNPDRFFDETFAENISSKPVIKLTEAQPAYFITSKGSPVITFNISATGKSRSIILRELCLMLKNADNSIKIFSRVTFNPIILEAGVSEELEYSIYF